jgi:hypothetical protein
MCIGNPGEPGLPAKLVLEPDPVIGELQALVPSPEVVKVRKAAAAKKTPG